MNYQISIDFGNSSTKVGVATGRPSIQTARLARSPACSRTNGSKWMNANFCIPTLAARGMEQGEEVWCYGNDLVAKTSTSGELRVYRNWKPLFFANEGPGTTKDGTPSGKLV